VSSLSDDAYGGVLIDVRCVVSRLFY
jgi:hypothetical protein